MRLIASLFASLVCTGSLLAQGTTWTSFEDRKGHAIATSPNGGVLMFGGESVEQQGKLLGDTGSLASNNQTWTRVAKNTSPAPRTKHAMAAATMLGQPVFIMFGGSRETATPGVQQPVNETFCYEGGSWGKVDPPAGSPVPSARTGHAMVSDLWRNRVVMFGGFASGVPQNDLWEFDPNTGTWTQVLANFAPGSPSPRFGHTMAFDSLNGRIYLFGGSPFLDDTWEYDPYSQSWTNITQTTRPWPRLYAAMGYLAAFDRITLFGGKGSSLNARDDTWMLDPSTGVWTEVFPATTPPARFDHAVAPDQFGTQVVMLGGTDGSQTALDSTWLWDGQNWTEGLPPPSPRTGVAMAYDEGRDLHVVFGGRDVTSGVDLAETWELDGLNWHQRNPSSSPSPRADAGLVFDAARNRTVLFGGRSGGECGTPLGDTWEWDGSGWSPRALANNPPAAGGVQPVFDSSRNVVWMLVGADMWMYDGIDWQAAGSPEGRAGFAMAYDSGRERLVVFGGGTVSTGEQGSDTWEWGPLGWRRITPPTAPTGRRYNNMVYDPVAGVCVHYGGYNNSSFGFQDTYLWDGASWQASSVHPGSRSASPLAYFAASPGGVLQYGGAYNTTAYDQTWLRSGGSWSQLAPPTTPPQKYSHGLAYDPIRQVAVMFGGRDFGAIHADTWEFDGTDWQQVLPASGSPMGRYQHGMCFDPSTNEVLVFGGSDSGGSIRGDTWSWDGSTWTLRNPPASPQARTGHVMVRAGSRVLLFGGLAAVGGIRLNDLWEWNGSTWTQLDAGPPPSRTGYAAAFDKARDRVVIFGGRSTCGGGTIFSDTWEWTGSGWLQRFPSVSPSPRERARMTYDEARGRIVLFGGTDGNNTFSDTWEWDGVDWTQRLPTQSPDGSYGHGLTFDRARRLSVAFGAMGTWDYGPTDPGTVVSHPTSSACVGSSGPITIAPTYTTGPWLGDPIGIDVTNAPLVNIAVMIFGFDDTLWNGISLPFPLFSFNSPLCELNIEAAILEVAFPLPSPYLSPAMPNTTSLVGTKLFLQGAFFDGGQTGLPLITSNYLEMSLGAK